MKIIYDQEKAVQEKLRIDAETTAVIVHNQQTRKRNQHRLFLSTLISVLALFCLLLVDQFVRPALNLTSTGTLLWNIFGTLIILGIAVLYLHHYYFREPMVPSRPEDRYPPTVKYHLLTQNQTVLEAELFYDYSTAPAQPYLRLTLEDQNHVVRKNYGITFPSVHTETRTDISEAVFDLDACILCKPYTKEE